MARISNGVLACLAALVLSSPAAAAIRYVDGTDPTCGGQTPCYGDIQSAVTAAQAGDTVRVAAGGYAEQVDIENKTNLLVEGDPAAAAGSVVVDPLGGPSLPNCVLEDGAIRISSSSDVTLRRLLVTEYPGHGIWLRGGAEANDSITLDGLRVVGIGRSSCGDGIRVEEGNQDTVLVHNVVHGNDATGIAFDALPPTGEVQTPFLWGNTVFGNGAHGVLVSGFDQLTLVNNLLVGNGTGAHSGYGVARDVSGTALPATGSDMELTNNLVCGNAAGELHLAATEEPTASGNLTPTGTEGPGFAASPGCDDPAVLFANGPGTDGTWGTRDDDFFPRAGSPAVDAGALPAPGANLALLQRDHVRSAVRPADGDGDGSLDYDIGSHEYGVAPTIAIASPAEGSTSPTSEPTVAGSFTGTAPLSIDVDGLAPSITGLTYEVGVTLVDGINAITATASNAFGTATAVVNVTLPPLAISIASPADGTTTDATTATVTGSVNDTAAQVDVNGVTASRTGTEFEADIGLDLYTNRVLATAVRSSSSASDQISIIRASEPVPEPAPPAATSASPVGPTTAFDLGDSTSFLYQGDDPAQEVPPILDEQGDPILDEDGNPVTPFEEHRVAVVRGQVLDRDGMPLGGVRISAKDSPEFGHTTSREDGSYDLVVNGGRSYTLDYSYPAWIPAQRLVTVPWRDFEVVDDVVLLPFDGHATVIDLASPPADIQVARGPVSTDEDGARQATVFFPAGTTATARRPDGSTFGLSTLTVRLTEFTVGDRGPEAMPAPLPPASGYTYAAELSVDEALVEGAKTVEFSPPVVFYLDNFLGLPPGMIVPVGTYDYERATWVPEKNGTVIRIDAVEDGLAVVTPDPGLSSAERAELASLYGPGQELWRAERSHFSPMDPNQPRGFGPGAEQPPGGLANDPPVCCPSTAPGSVIEIENQVLGEEIPLAQVPFNLHYRSNRVVGFEQDRTTRIPITTDNPPASLERVDVVVGVAGKRETFSFPPTASQPPFVHTWDGVDAYGRQIFGGMPATVEVGWVYEAVIGETQNPESFGQTTDTYTNITAREEAIAWRRHATELHQLDARGWGIGGWTFDAHHFYDPATETLHRGDGYRRDIGQVAEVMNRVAGGPHVFHNRTQNVPGPASKVRFGGNYLPGVAAAPDGTVYLAEQTDVSFAANRVYQIERDGWMSYVTGSDSDPYTLGGPAISTRIGQPSDIAVGPDGSVYIAEHTGSPIDPASRILRIDPEGIIDLFAGGGSSVADPCNDDPLLDEGETARGATICLYAGSQIEVAPDGSVYFSKPNDGGGTGTIRRVRPDGILETVVDSRGGRGTIEGLLSTNLSGEAVERFTLDPEGKIYFATRWTSSIYSIRPEDGVVERVAGGGSPADGVGDGLPALEAAFHLIEDLAFSPEGVLCVAETQANTNAGVIRGFVPGGEIRRIAGDGARAVSGNRGPALQASLALHIGTLSRMAIDPNGAIYINQMLIDDRLEFRSLKKPVPVPVAFDEITVISRGGTQLYDFARDGRHLRTRSARTGAALTTFAYDTNDRLVEARQLAPSGNAADDLVTTIERDTSGDPTAIVGPYGGQTVLGVDTNGYLASVSNPAGDTHLLTSSDTGLLTAFTTPEGGSYAFHYDDLGNLTLDEDAGDGFQQLTVTEQGDPLEVEIETALGRIQTRRTEIGAEGALERTFTDAAGFQTTRYESESDLMITQRPDGTRTEVTYGAEPRFGLLAPIAAERRVATVGSERVETLSRTATVDSEDFLESQLDTLTVNGRQTTIDWDGLTRTQTTTSPVGREAVAVFDTQERLVESELVGLEPVFFGYDDRGRLVSTSQGTGALERLTTVAYDSEGNVASLTDPLLRSVSFGYDAAGRLETMTLPGSRVVEYDYDANGNLSFLKPPGQPAHVFRYTALDQESEYEPPAVDANDPRTLYTYDLDRALTDVDRPDGSFVDLGYDGFGRLETLTTPRGTTSYGYSATTGQLASLTAPGGEGLDLGYDGFLPTATTWSGSVAGSVSQSYDDDFRVATQWVNGGSAVSFFYDGDGLLEAAGALDVGRDLATGLVTSSTVGGVDTTHGYNTFGELASQSASAGATSLYSASYTRDDLGRITQKLETVQGVTTTTDYAYDAAGRLEHVYEDGLLVRSYGYDANGNRTSLTDGSGTTFGSHDAQDRLTAWGVYTYTHDAAGDLTNRTDTATLETTGYTYDALGNLVQVALPAGGGTIDYVIDAQNRRVGKKVNGVLVQGFLYQDALNPVAELDGLGNVVSRFVYGSRANVPDYMVKGGSTYRILSDHLGSVRLVVDASTGTVVQRIDYDEFGNITQDTNPGFQPFGFAGGLYDADTSLTRFGARDYDPVVGRWTTKDPIRFDGGLNLYGYVLGDPVNLVDPSGLIPPGWARRNLHHQPVPATDAEKALGHMQLGTALQGAGIVGLAAPNPYARAAGFASGLAGTIIYQNANPNDGDNDNDGIPDAVDPDDDNDLIPDLIDPSPLIPCSPMQGQCYTPAANACE